MHSNTIDAIAKIFYPKLLDDNIEIILSSFKIYSIWIELYLGLIFDVGDVLILRNLTGIYNWNLIN